MSYVQVCYTRLIAHCESRHQTSSCINHQLHTITDFSKPFTTLKMAKPKSKSPKTSPRVERSPTKPMERDIQFLLLVIRSYNKTVCTHPGHQVDSRANSLSSQTTRPPQMSWASVDRSPQIVSICCARSIHLRPSLKLASARRAPAHLTRPRVRRKMEMQPSNILSR